MFSKLVEASKLEIRKGAYQLSFDETEKAVKVIDRKNGSINYIVTGDNDEMLFATIIYFGLRSK